MIEHIEANGISNAFRRVGKGPPIVLLHGAEADHSMFDAFAAELSSRFTVIAPDQCDSGATKNPDRIYGFDDLADDVGGMIAALGYARAHVFGTSLGGAIAQLLATRHPSRVNRLVLSSTFRVGMPLAEINPVGAPKIAELRSKLPGSLPELARFFFPEEYIQAHPEALNIFTGNKRSDDQKKRRAAIATKPVKLNLGDVKSPTLVLAGSEDRLIPSLHTLSLANDIAQSKTATILGVGHVGTIQAPALVAAEVSAFLLG
jgi:3-oxoadipate enol-lactonase